MEITERIIIEQLKRGNEEAYKYLYRHHYALLCHIAREYVGDDFLAETLVGDVVFHLWEVHETLDIQVSLRSYLVRAVRNHCMKSAGKFLSKVVSRGKNMKKSLQS